MCSRRTTLIRPHFTPTRPASDLASGLTARDRMFWFLIVLICIDALLLSVAVLLQSGKGGGLAGVAAGGQTQQILGARQAPDFLEKASWTLGGLFIFLSMIASFFAGGSRESVLQSREPVSAPVTAPALPAPTEGLAPAPATPAPAPAPSAEPPVAE